MDNQPGSLSEICSVNTNSAQVVWDSRVSATTHELWKLDCQLMNLAIRSLIIKARWIKSVVGKPSSSEVHTQWLRDALVVVKEGNATRPGCRSPFLPLPVKSCYLVHQLSFEIDFIWKKEKTSALLLKRV